MIIMETPFSEFAPERATSFFDDSMGSPAVGVLDANSPLPARGVDPVVRGRASLLRPKAPASYPLKRAIDIAVALSALVLLAPLLAVLWVLVVTTSPGPGLYWSRRVGRFGRTFHMPKFRTMISLAPVGPRETLADADSLITPIGAILRRSSLDELPQLFCVLCGDMSLVGPRPLLPNDPGALARLEFPLAVEAKPGLTGIAQVSGRNEVSARRKARLDALYARSASMSVDIGVIMRTVKILFSGRGFV
jgi:O-antigen biosynthesis protein WbqP